RRAAELELAELHPQAVVGEKTPDERISATEEKLDRLRRLEQSDDAGKDAEDACLLAARREVRRRRLGIEAAVTGPRCDPELLRRAVGHERRQLAVEAEDRSV